MTQLGCIGDPGTPIGPSQRKLLNRKFRQAPPDDEVAFVGAMIHTDPVALQGLFPDLVDSKVWREQTERAIKDSRAEMLRLTQDSLANRGLPDRFVVWMKKEREEQEFALLELNPPDISQYDAFYIDRDKVLFDRNAFTNTMEQGNPLVADWNSLEELTADEKAQLQKYIDEHGKILKPDPVHPFTRPKAPRHRRAPARPVDAPVVEPAPVRPGEWPRKITHQPNKTVSDTEAMMYSKERIRAMDDYLEEQMGFPSDWTGEVQPIRDMKSWRGGNSTVMARKNWSCSMSVNGNVWGKKIPYNSLPDALEIKNGYIELHELFHAVSQCSAAQFNYLSGLEEAVVEGAARAFAPEVFESGLGIDVSESATKQYLFRVQKSTIYDRATETINEIIDYTGHLRTDVYRTLIEERNLEERDLMIRRMVREAVDSGQISKSHGVQLLDDYVKEMDRLNNPNPYDVVKEAANIERAIADNEVLSIEEQIDQVRVALDKALKKEAKYAADPPSAADLRKYKKQVDDAVRSGGEYRGNVYDRAASRARLNNEFADAGFGSPMSEEELKAYSMHPKRLTQGVSESDSAFAARKAAEKARVEKYRMKEYTKAECDRLGIEFTDAHTYDVWTGERLTPDTISRDKIVGGIRGGRYTDDNLLPSSLHSNSSTGVLHKGGVGADTNATVTALRARLQELGNMLDDREFVTYEGAAAQDEVARIMREVFDPGTLRREEVERIFGYRYEGARVRLEELLGDFLREQIPGLPTIRILRSVRSVEDYVHTLENTRVLESLHAEAPAPVPEGLTAQQVVAMVEMQDRLIQEGYVFTREEIVYRVVDDRDGWFSPVAGSDFIDYSFVLGTMDKAAAEKEVKYKGGWVVQVVVPEGEHGMPMKDYTGFLFVRGATYHVVDVDSDKRVVVMVKR